MTISRTVSSRFFVVSPRAWLVALLTAGAMLLVGACTHGGPPPKPVPAQGSVAGLRVFVKSSGEADTAALEKSYSAALRWAGFVTVSSEQEAELVAELHLQVHQGARLLRLSSAAQSKRTAVVALVVRGQGQELGAASVEYDADGPVPAPALSRLTLAATTSEAVSDYADRLTAQELASGARSVEM